VPEGGTGEAGARALDGTKIKANASKHKAMSYERMEKAEKELAAEVQALLAEAARVDAEEDGKYGKGKRATNWPKETGAAGEPVRKDSGKRRRRLEQEAKEAAEKKQAEGRGAIAGAGEAGARTGAEVRGATAASPGPARGEAGAHKRNGILPIRNRGS